jgi:multidrug efflux pump
MLVGLITKNGILIVEFANQLRRKGMERIEAIIEASSLRLRPILMTAFATVLGALPLALSSGAGAEARAAIGWVIVGGMSNVDWYAADLVYYSGGLFVDRAQDSHDPGRARGA